jgi:hypothetical protein
VATLRGFLQVTAYFAKRKHVAAFAGNVTQMWHIRKSEKRMAKPRTERSLLFPSEEFRERVRKGAKDRGFRSEQAFILAACDNELRRGENADAATQFEARMAATLTNLAKQVQGLQTLAHAQVALTDVFLKYVIACVVELTCPRRMRYQRHAFAPGCVAKSWCVLQRKGSPTRTETLSKAWWPMNDEPIIRLRPRKSKHEPYENSGKYMDVLRFMLRFVQMLKRGQKTRCTHSADRSVRAKRTINQRVAVRVSYSSNKNPGQWHAHGRYVARESGAQGGRAADAGLNATEQNLDIAAKLYNWQGAGDERLFKVIVSPQFGDRLTSISRLASRCTCWNMTWVRNSNGSPRFITTPSIPTYT